MEGNIDVLVWVEDLLRGGEKKNVGRGELLLPPQNPAPPPEVRAPLAPCVYPWLPRVWRRAGRCRRGDHGEKVRTRESGNQKKFYTGHAWAGGLHSLGAALGCV